MIIALGGVAVLAAAIAVALSQRGNHNGSASLGAGAWYTALAAPYTASVTAHKGACGVVIGPRTIGVAHPVLPCGVKLYVEFGGRDVLTQVIDRAHTVPGHDFDLTIALARALGVHGVQTIRWRFAK